VSRTVDIAIVGSGLGGLMAGALLARRGISEALYERTRARSRELVRGLKPEDMTVQSMEDASPTKWHLAHTSWFFEQFILREHAPGYRSPDDRFAFLFNSYYVQAGPRHSRSARGLITRPTVDDVMAFLPQVDGVLLVVDGTKTVAEDIAQCQKMLQKPVADAERYARVWESVRALDGAYEMKP
jgi:choline dehydrogenase-like flavoprotein